jgi:hypothetical protein
MYKGEVFHVQTEDSGVGNPHIITLLYRGGVIISSKKTSYSDILKMEHLEAVVEELMKEQHKEMMRRLKGGEFDEKAFSFKAQLMENYKIPTLEPELNPIAEFLVPPTSSPLAENETVSQLVELASRTMNNDLPVQGQKTETSDPNSLAVNLDDAILSFFGSREK